MPFPQFRAIPLRVVTTELRGTFELFFAELPPDLPGSDDDFTLEELLLTADVVTRCSAGIARAARSLNSGRALQETN
jgi:hypothetical protein